ncbi:hypothetical protein C8Q76DRAFT_723714 [Earliella scabrosa]|nr:hypothetical protein C8Q76DRAFT_723714 [Earliella scabrosa]
MTTRSAITKTVHRPLPSALSQNRLRADPPPPITEYCPTDIHVLQARNRHSPPPTRKTSPESTAAR